MKKDETRYTIRFNPADPRHKIAMEALNTAGRRKATLIADAVYEYLARYSGDGTPLHLTDSRQDMIYKPNYLQDKRLPTEPASKSASQDIETVLNEAAPVSSEDALINNNMRQTILGGLNMFNEQTETK